MSEEVEEYKDPQLKDISYNWVNSSVFLFYLEVFCILALLWAAVTASTRTAIRANRKW